ncbi:MAG: substrate-binding domain-containing protein [Actinomycetes bacterium]|jgi:phosphate transport system substrate-binding protein
MKLSSSIKVIAATTVAFALALAPAANATTWKAGGASSVNGLMAACKAAYQTSTGDDFPYNGTGSGDGKTGIHNATMDFAFSDSVDTAPIANEIHLPSFVWPVAILVNMGADTKGISLSTKTIAGIFAGTIKTWNDPAIVADNNKSVNVPVYKKDASGAVVKDAAGAPVVLKTVSKVLHHTFPSTKIVVYYRTKNSGTSNNLSRALNKLEPTIWTKSPNDSFATAFPGDITKNPVQFRGAAGSGDVANGVKNTPWSITYAEVGFAASPYNLTIASVINGAGNSITPSSDSAMAAASEATVAADGTVTFNYANTNAAAYPFTATTYALALTNYGSTTKGAGVKKTLDYLANNCAKDNPKEGFGAYSATNAFAKAFASQLAKLGA